MSPFNSHRLIYGAALFMAFTLVAPLAGEEPDVAYAAANIDFEAGKFDAAASKYLDLAKSGHISSDLYFNLGNARYRLGDVGEAILWMRRALVVEPAMPEVRQSLEFLRTKVAYLEFTEGRAGRVIGTLPATFAKWIFSIAVWTGLIALALAFCVRRMRPRRAALIALAIVAGMGAFAASWVGNYRATRIAVENFATITRTGVSALTAPAPEAKSVIDLPPGSEVRILKDSGPWRYAEIPGDLRGWIRAESLEPVWPIASPKTTP